MTRNLSEQFHIPRVLIRVLPISEAPNTTQEASRYAPVAAITPVVNRAYGDFILANAVLRTGRLQTDRCIIGPVVWEKRHAV